METLRSTSRRLLEVVPERYSQNQVTRDEQGTAEPDPSTSEAVTSSSESSTSVSPAPTASTVSTGAVLQQRDARAEDSGETGIEPAGAVLYNPGRFVQSKIQNIVQTNLEFFHLRVPNCQALCRCRRSNNWIRSVHLSCCWGCFDGVEAVLSGHTRFCPR